MDSDRPEQEKKRRGFPIAAIFLLMTSAACALACVDFVKFREQFAKEPMVVLSLCGGVGIIGSILVGIISLFSAYRWRGLLGGLFIGLLAGAFIAILVMAPAHPLRAFGAAIALVAASLVFKWNAV